MNDISKEDLRRVIEHYNISDSISKIDFESSKTLSDAWFDYPKYFVPEFIVKQLEDDMRIWQGLEVLTVDRVLRILDLRHQIKSHTEAK
ncbi:MAG: hypothetical protein BMS9Abin31_0140 [Gammaproteobacteria bacterium]|nr:MAG: hypothetical protein BMS9Abin31_0140 [Gammaproteobacteria bacterium]